MPKLCFVCQKYDEDIAHFEVNKQRVTSWSTFFDGINVGHRVCEKHFSPNDVIKVKVVKDGLGNIIAEQKYKNAILLQNAIPNIKCTIPYENVNREIGEDDDLDNTLDRSEMKRVYSNKRLTSSTYVLPSHNETKKTCLTSIYKTKNQKSHDFNKVLNDVNTGLIPFNWTRILPANNKMVIFSKVMVNSINLPYFERYVSVHEDMTVECRYLNKIINNDLILKQSYLSNQDFKQLNIQNMILNFDLANMCCGVKIPEEDTKYLTKTTYKDVSDCIRHINCISILKKPGNCKFCQTILQLIKKKKFKSPK